MGTSPGPTGVVVVGCDRSWEGQNAVVAATREASLRGSELVLLAAVETHRLWRDGPTWITRREAEAKLEAQGALDLAITQVRAADSAVPLRTVLLDEFESPAMSDLVRRAGLLVLGRRGSAGQVAFSLGTTSSELARYFRCPILLVSDRGVPTKCQNGHEYAVFAGMGSAGGADQVLSIAATEAVIRHMPLFVVHALPPDQAVDGASLNEGWRSCRASLNEAPSRPDALARLVITRDDPVRVLLGLVAPGDLLVIGTHGQGRLAGLVTGSVSRKILDEVTCDVIVIPPVLRAPAKAPPRQGQRRRQISWRGAELETLSRGLARPLSTGGEE